MCMYIYIYGICIYIYIYIHSHAVQWPISSWENDDKVNGWNGVCQFQHETQRLHTCISR